MRSCDGILALPGDLRQQLLAMPLTMDEKNDVATALLSLPPAPRFPPLHACANKNAPRPDRLRGV